jgi:hypothetical protein
MVPLTSVNWHTRGARHHSLEFSKVDGSFICPSIPPCQARRGGFFMLKRPV